MKDAINIKLLFAIVLTAIPVAAQDNLKKSDDFFGSDYAKSPLQGKSGATINMPRGKATPNPLDALKAKPTPKKKPSKSSTGGGFEEMSADEPPEPEETPAADENPQLFARTIPVVAVGVILNTADKSHAAEKVSELIELTRRYKWRVAEIYSMGGIQDAIDKQDMKALMENGASLLRHSAVPARYSAAKLSPTWIVKTKEGEVLLEATGPLKQHFNAKGEIQFN